MEDIAKNNFSLKACYLMPKSIFIICWKLWHSFFQFSCVLKTIPKTCGLLVVSNEIFKARSGCQ